MRKLIFAINLTLDGCCDHTKLNGDDETLEYHTQLLQYVDILLYGRKTYQLMVPFWPDVARDQSGPTKSMNDFARAFASVKEILVCSQSMGKAEARNTRVIRTGLKEEIIKLKQQEGKHILMGGVDLPSQLIQLGLVDEFHFVFQPVVVGAGRRLFDKINLPEHLALKLAETKTFNSGGIAMRFVNGK
ncbi:MAG: dihydrofolate reductase family protein [Bacteroidetes bacterium]|nr:dihydrofolate reductase family protein [Bacteroidota bacterium]